LSGICEPERALPGGDENVVYQCRLPLSTATIRYASGVLRGHLKKIGSPWRALPPGRITVIVLGVLRHDQRLCDMAGGNAVHRTTVGRWVKELVILLAACVPRLDRALKHITRKGGRVVLIDGTLVPTVRRTGADNRRNFSGKHKRHGLLFLALTDENGRLLWISRARPGRFSEITATRHDHITTWLRAEGPGAIADLGFIGVDPEADALGPVVITGYKAAPGKRLSRSKKQVNKLIAAERAACEHGFAHLKTWRIPTKIRYGLSWATQLLRALLVLTRIEVAR
jgi:hypothetical protein